MTLTLAASGVFSETKGANSVRDRSHRVRTVVSKILHRSLNAIPGFRYRSWEVFRCQREQFSLVADPAVRPSLIGVSNLAFLKQVNREIGDISVLRERFRSGNECWITLFGGRPAHYQWVIRNSGRRKLDLHLTSRAPKGLTLPTQGLYLWDAWCAVDMRNQGVNRKAKSAILSDFFDYGGTEAITIVAPFNEASQRSLRSLGFVEERRMTELGLRWRKV